MTEIKMNVEAIRVQLGMSKPDMAQRLKVNADRYNRLASGESRMLAVELIRLHEASGIPYENIDVREEV